MLSIGKFFERIQNVRTKEVYLRQVVQETIKRITSAELPIDSIEIKSDSITLKGTSSALRSTIYVKKQTILDEVNSVQKIRKFTDLR